MSSIRFIISAFLLPSIVFAHPSSLPDAPILPGTKIIAGKASENEFFIVAENDVHQLKEVFNPQNDQPIASIEKSNDDLQQINMKIKLAFDHMRKAHAPRSLQQPEQKPPVTFNSDIKRKPIGENKARDISRLFRQNTKISSQHVNTAIRQPKMTSHSISPQVKQIFKALPIQTARRKALPIALQKPALKMALAKKQMHLALPQRKAITDREVLTDLSSKVENALQSARPHAINPKVKMKQLAVQVKPRKMQQQKSMVSLKKKQQKILLSHSANKQSQAKSLAKKSISDVTRLSVLKKHITHDKIETYVVTNEG